MKQEYPAMHPAVAVAVGMTAFVAVGLGIALWPVFQGNDSASQFKQARERLRTGSIVYVGQIVVGEPRSEQGLKLTFEIGGEKDSRAARLVALYVPAGQSPTPVLAAGPFTAIWAGEINVALRDRYVFSYEGNGDFELKIGDETVLNAKAGNKGTYESKRVALRNGANKMTAAFRAPAKGDAFVRLYWSSGDIVKEPVPPTVFTHNAEDAVLLAGQKMRNMLEQSFPERDVPIEYAERQIKELRCDLCHRMDGREDKFSEFAAANPGTGVPGRLENANDPQLDQSRPSLTFAGEKLRVEFMRKHIAGELGYLPRPWLAVRMPAYPAQAKGIAEGLAMSHGYPPVDAPLEKPDPKLAEIGAKLVTKQYGFGCVDCHAIGSQKAQAVFEAEGVNFAHAAERLRPGYYHRWMLDPTRIEPGTKMPRYADAYGSTPLSDVLGGDAEKQFEAIRHYLLTLPGK